MLACKQMDGIEMARCEVARSLRQSGGFARLESHWWVFTIYEYPVISLSGLERFLARDRLLFDLDILPADPFGYVDRHRPNQ
jgi:hypothetical protein